MEEITVSAVKELEAQNILAKELTQGGFKPKAAELSIKTGQLNNLISKEIPKES